MDLKQMVDERFDIFVGSGEIEKFIDGAIAKSVKSAVDSYFDWDFGKKIKEEISKKLDLDLSKIDIQPYLVSVTDIVGNMIKDRIETDILDATKKQLDEIIGEYKEEYKLSELLEDLLGDDEDAEITLHMEEARKWSDPKRTIKVWVDEDTGTKKEDCQYHFAVDVDKGNELDFIYIDKESYRRGNWVNTNAHHALGRALYNAHLRGSRIALDQGYDADDYKTNNECDY